MTAPYVSFHGLTLCDSSESIVDIDGISESGGNRKTESYSGAGRDYAEIAEEGRDAATFSFEMHSTTRADIEAAVAELNTAPADAEFYPRESDRCVYAAFASGSRPKILQMAGPANYYYAEAEIIARNGLTYGPEQGSGFLTGQSLPYVGASLTNSGYYDSTLDYLYLSGGYDAATGLTRDVLLEIGDYDIPLCDMLMWKDGFQIDRFGNVLHKKYTDFPMVYSSLQAALGGSTFVDYGTGGSIAHEAFVMGNNGKLMFPFYGPLPAAGSPYIEVTLASVVGSPEVEVAFATDLSDSEAITYTLKAGVNKIYVPECEGEDFVSVGITTGASSSCTISEILAQVARYISPDEFPIIEMNDTFTYTISDGEFSNHTLEALHFVYRDVF